MKKLFSYLMIFACLLGTAVITSCGSDDDKEVTLETPKFESDAALYRIVETNDEKISYIELSSAGNYFIEYLTMVKSKVATLNVNDTEISLPFSISNTETRTSKDNFEYGSYKKNEDGSFELDGKGTLKIETAADGKYIITITNSEKTKTYIGVKEAKIVNTATTSKICRSWRMRKVYVNRSSNVDGVTSNISEEASSYKSLMDKLNKYEGFDFTKFIDELDYISFSNTGSYIVKTDNSIDRCYWKWDESNNTLYLKKDSQIALVVSFDGKKMKMNYSMKRDLGEAGYTTTELGYEFEETLVR